MIAAISSLLLEECWSCGNDVCRYYNFITKIFKVDKKIINYMKMTAHFLFLILEI